MASGNPLLNALNSVSLVAQIAIGLVLGILVGAFSPQVGISAGLLGSLFVGALKAIAPILVFVLVTAAIAQHQKGNQAHIKPILILYIFGTFAAAVVAVVASLAFPTTLILRTAGDVSVAPPSGIIEVLKTLLMNLVANPINALANANYIGIFGLGFGIGRGFAPSRFGYDPPSGGRFGRYCFDRCEVDYPFCAAGYFRLGVFYHCRNRF